MPRQYQKLRAEVVVAFLLALCSILNGACAALAPILTSTSSLKPATPDSNRNVNSQSNALAETESSSQVRRTKDVVTTVAVAGATGRTGRYVIQELLDRDVKQVVALVRDLDQAEKTLYPQQRPHNLKLVQCNLGRPQEIEASLQGVDAAIWCATGFSDAPGTNVWERLRRIFGFAFRANQTIDVVGVPAFAKCIAKNNNNNNDDDDGIVRPPRMVMCSSGGVTRPNWSEEKKAAFSGAAEIPIVRINPFSILDRKRESEDELRRILSGNNNNYCIVRPGGLNDDCPSGSRPLFSQGDVAVGRIHRKDVASILVDVLSTAEATGKTFEVIALAGYPKQPHGLGPALARLRRDDAVDEDDAAVRATYALMQQFLPGERQDSAALAMGQTYEQLDKGTTGRLGKRGSENVDLAGLKPSS